MYYELYVDVLFLVNFMMDYLLLLLVKKMLQCSGTHGSVCAGAALGAFLTCILVILPTVSAVLKFLMFHILVNTLMIRVGLKIKTIRDFTKAFLMLYIGGFLMGGVMEAFRPYVKIGSLFFVTAIAGYYLVSGIWNFLSDVHRTACSKCHVELYLGEREYSVDGLMDTGNRLCDPLTNEPVSVLDKKTAGELLGEGIPEGIRYIPYCSIGKKEGLLPAVKIDKMCICAQEKHWIQEPLIGISEEESFAKGEYQMILNSDLF